MKKYGLFLQYEPGESLEKIKGGNSNWRGPIWFPINYMLIDTLSRLSVGFQDAIKIAVEQEAPITLQEMADSFATRLISLFKRNAEGNRPVYGDNEKLQKDPHFKDLLLFYEHFHGDDGHGLGASPPKWLDGTYCELDSQPPL